MTSNRIDIISLLPIILNSAFELNKHIIPVKMIWRLSYDPDVLNILKRENEQKCIEAI